MIRKASPLLAAAFLLASSFGHVLAQDAPDQLPKTPFEKQLSRLDLAVTGVGEFNTTVSGTIIPSSSNQGQAVTQFASNTLGALVTLRYVAKPYFGLEGNIGYARYTENYSGQGIASSFGFSPFQIQTRASEYTLGYVVTPPHLIFGLQPFASAGSGSMAFKPTNAGGQGQKEQARQVYYYSLGVQQEYLSHHFGLRAGFRELFLLDPDFGQNYLTIKKHASTYEPMAGFYLRY